MKQIERIFEVGFDGIRDETAVAVCGNGRSETVECLSWGE